MRITERVKTILSWYEGDPPGGSIIGRNTFQRPKPEALDMLSKIIGIYQGRD